MENILSCNSWIIYIYIYLSANIAQYVSTYIHMLCARIIYVTLSFDSVSKKIKYNFAR